MERPRIWRCGAFAFGLARPLIMGVLNVTPDSFSDGGSYADRDAAISAALTMLVDGADIIDVGGESTRPGAEPVTAAQEVGRVVGVVRVLAGQGICVSVDTRHAVVAAEALAAGAAIINDVSGFADPDMLRVAAGSDAGLVAMHMRGEPRTMQDAPAYEDVVGEVAAFLQQRSDTLERAGVERERIAIDPGIGFGKTTAHNLELLRRLPELAATGVPVVVGASRKRFIGEITGVAEPSDRLAGSIAAALVAAQGGASVVRVHDVAATVQALTVLWAVEGEVSDGE
jgi:dihydropteroate synthase